MRPAIDVGEGNGDGGAQRGEFEGLVERHERDALPAGRAVVVMAIRRSLPAGKRDQIAPLTPRVVRA